MSAPAPTGRRPSTLLGLAWPLMISFTMRSILTSIDIPYASLLGDEAIAAIGLAFPLEFAFIACWVGVSSALTSHLSRAFGEANEARIGQLLRTATRILVVLAVFFLGLAAAVWAVAPRLGLDPAVAANFRLYAPIVIAGAAIAGLWSALPDSIVKAHHDTRSTMVAGLITAFSNVLLNTFTVFVLGWGIAGIALSTGFARVGALVYALGRARALETARRGEAAETPPAAGPLLERPYRALLVLGVPTAVTFALIGAEIFVVNAVLSRFEDATAYLAAYAIYHRASFLFLMPIVATGVALVPFVSRNAGAGRIREVEAGVRQALGFALGYSALVTFPICLAAAGPIAAWLGSAEATRRTAEFAIRFAVPLTVLASAPFNLCRPVFEGFQRGVPGLAMATLRYLVLSIPLAIAGAHAATVFGRPPFEGVVAALILASAVVSIAFLAWTRLLLRNLRGLDAT